MGVIPTRKMPMGVAAKRGGGGGYWGLCFTAKEPGVIVNMAKTGSPPAITLETSFDGTTWTAFDADGGTTPVTLAKAGDKVYFRAGASGNATLSTSADYYRSFVLSGFCGASGDISSLLDRNNTVLTLAECCYERMFSGCTSLTSAPELPATTMAKYCYRSMFRGCTSLVSAPELPATTLKILCYGLMFDGCTSLTSAPELPATSVVAYCYQSMFRGCTSLVSAPELPATRVPTYAYNDMFSGCTSLTSVRVRFTSWGGSARWLTGVGSSGTFYCPAELGTNETIARGVSRCPDGWTVINI